MIEFTKEDLNKIREDLRGTLESAFMGDPTSMDVELAGATNFDLKFTEVAHLQMILAKIHDALRP